MGSRRSGRRDRDYGHAWVVAESLLGGPKTPDEILDYFGNYLWFAGFFLVSQRILQGRRRERAVRMVDEAVRIASARGWIEKEEGGRYALSPTGRAEVEKILVDMRRARAGLATLLEPITVSKTSLVVHFFLAALKLPAALMSGSVALLNDGIDTLLDGASSVLVLLGIRWDRERAANVVLVVFMLGTGGWTLAEAVTSFFTPAALTSDCWLAVSAALVSALLCSGLWAYQRFVGLRAVSPALITQSVDSRNHVLVAIGVLAGLVASLLRFPWLDRIVGLAIALLILKSAVELLIEVVRTRDEEAIDLSRYRFGPGERYRSFRSRQFRNWLLFFINEHEPIERSAAARKVLRILDFRRMPTLDELGIADAHAVRSEDIDRSLDSFIEGGLIVDTNGLRLTSSGRGVIQRYLGRLA